MGFVEVLIGLLRVAACERIGVDELKVEPPVWSCLRCPWQYPGGRHALGTVKGVLVAAPAGPHSSRWGVHGIRWALTEALGHG